MATSALRPGTGGAIVAQARYLARATTWQGIAGGTALGVGAVALARLHDGPLPAAVAVAVVAIATGAAFVLDDPAATLLASVPATLRRRTADRALLAAALSAAGLAAVAGTALASLSYGDVATDAAAVLAVGLCVAAAAGRLLGRTRPGMVGAGAVLALLVVDGLLPQRWAVLTGGGGGTLLSPRALVAAAALGGLAWATVDPAGRGRRPARPVARRGHRRRRPWRGSGKARPTTRA